ncbi:MAG: hypothetical protein IT436_08750 [Phycisphaerales bacterium]|nr:hypothetical protein [Phycisphaerales bacterium]
MPAEAPVTVHPAPVCPECGHLHDGSTPAPLKRARRLWARRGAALGLLALIVVIVAPSQTYRFAFSGETIPRIVTPAFTTAQLRALAEDLPAPAGLANGVLQASEPIDPGQPGRRRILVGFVHADIAHRQSWTFGWPTPWLACTRSSFYEDAVRGEGFIPAVTDSQAEVYRPHTLPRDARRLPPRPRLTWERASLIWYVRPELTSGIDISTSFSPLALAPAVVILFASWFLAGVVARRRGVTDRRRLRRARLIASAGAAIILIAAALMTAKTEDHPLYVMPGMTQVGMPPAVAFSYNGFQPLPTDRDGIQELAARGHDGDVRLARQIIHDTGSTNLDDGKPWYLASTALIETVVDDKQSLSWHPRALPFLSFSRATYLRRPEFGPGQYVPADRSLRVRWKDDWLLISFAPGSGPAYRLGLNPELPALLILFMLVGAFLCARASSRLFRARARRRTAAGRCILCNYQMLVASIAPPPPQAPAHDSGRRD